MNWKQVTKLEFTDKELEIINFYCADELRELKKVCFPIIKQKDGVSGKDYDDLIDVALMTLIEVVKDYNSEKSQFKTYLVSSIKRAFYDWTRDNIRGKRCNLERDKNGKIKYKENENGKKIPIPIWDVSYDAPVEDGIDIRERITKTTDTCEYSENVEKYLSTLTDTERKIAELVIEGYSLKEIQENLKLTDKKFAKIINNMKSFQRHQIIHSNNCNIIKEDKQMNMQTTTLEKSKPDRLSIASINKKIDNYTIRFDHPLQRESEQWSNVMKGNLISDILQGNPIPSLTFAEQIINGIAIIWDLDGKQRCTNTYSFAKDKFKISRNIRRWMISYQAIVKDENGKPVLDENGFPKTEKREFDIRNKKFSNLPEELQDKFMDYNFEIVQYLNCSEEDIAYHIARYNEGKPMNTQQKGIIRLGERFASLVKGISAMPFFKEMGNYTVRECNNGTINRVVVESIMTTNFLEDWNKDQSVICEFLRDNASEETFDNFEELVNRLSKVVDNNDEILEEFNSKNSFIWFGLFGRFVNNCDNDKKFIEFMAEFGQPLHKAFEEIEYDENGKKKHSTKDKAIVHEKMNKAIELMNEFLNIKNEENIETEEEDNKIDGNNETAVSLGNNLESDDENAPLDEKNDTNKQILEFCKETVSGEIDKEDVELYSDMIDDCVRIDSPVYINCKNALIGLMGFAVRENKDEEFEEWIGKYQQNKSNFSPSQKINFTYMKNDFNKYLLQKGMAING